MARVIDTHQPLIETYYGPGRLLSAITILQKECDAQTKKILLEFNKTRQLDKKISQINELNRMSASSSFGKLDKIEPKDLDVLIGEITIMHSRAELYIKFIKRKVAVRIFLLYFWYKNFKFTQQKVCYKHLLFKIKIYKIKMNKQVIYFMYVFVV